MNITLTDLLGIELYVIPIVPDGTAFAYGADYDVLETVNGKIRIPKETKLKTVAWASFFPVNKDYDFVASNSLPNGWDYVEFIENTLKNPIRVVATDDNKRTIENLVMTVDEFTKEPRPNGDLKYSIKLTEFPIDIWDILRGI